MDVSNSLKVNSWRCFFEALDYYDIIKQPMDLATVLEKINTYEYEDALQCVDDLKLIFTNSKTYNLVSLNKVV